MYDVTVSVWNQFHSFPLIQGLTSAGLDVLALGTTRRRPRCSEYHCCWTAAIATQLGHRIPSQRERFFAFALDKYEQFAAAHAENSRCFWGWSNHHLAAFEKAKMRGIPIILETGSTHVRWTREVLGREYKLRGKQLENTLFERLVPKMIAEYEIADRICVPSRFVARTFIAHGIPEDKLHINPYGVDVDFWSQYRRKFQTGKRPFVFVYAGQIMLRKGIAYLLEAWQQFNNPNAQLWLIGAVHPDCAELTKALPRGVRLLGHKNRFELRELYRRADAYLLPSLEEGLARSVLEAMAAGLPVIVTEETGATDVMQPGRDGWVVSPRNSESLALVFAEASGNPGETSQRGRSARQATKEFTWTAYGDRAAHFLNTVLQLQ